MANIDPIHVYIHTDENGSGGLENNVNSIDGAIPDNKQKIKNSNKSGAITFKQALIFREASMIGNSVFNFATNEYENITGDSVGQMQINNALGAAGHVTNIALGFAVGGIAGGVIATTGSILSLASQEAQRQIRINKSNIASQEYFKIYNLYNVDGGR